MQWKNSFLGHMLIDMFLRTDVVIPTNTSDSRSSIVLKAGQKVMVLKSPKGIYMQLENGKIIAIKTAIRNALSQGAQGNKVPGNMARNMPMNQGGMKMLPRPPMDRPLASLGNRRGRNFGFYFITMRCVNIFNVICFFT